MTRKHSSIDQLAATTAHQAQSESARMQGELKKLRDSVAGLDLKLKALNPVSHARTKRTKSNPSFLANLGMLGASDLLGGCYTSAAQSARANITAMVLGQRIR